MKENNKYQMLWIAIGLLLVLNIGLLAWFTFFSQKAQNVHPRQRLFLEKELSFDAKQAESYRLLRQTHAKQINQLREQVKMLKEAYYKDLTQTNISDEVLRTKAVAIEAKMVDADVLTFRHFQQVRQLCTPEQQKRFDEIIIDLLHSIERPGGGPPPPREGHRPMDGPPPPPRDDMPPPPPDR